MSNIFVLHHKLQEKFKTVHEQLIANIYEYKVDIILLNSTLCVPPKNKMYMFNFSSLTLITPPIKSFGQKRSTCRLQNGEIK